ncbi:MAG: hypothetical protein AB7T86_08080 [Xanthobacteraceae bacterium]|uniref:hypothetical protein n=1 Tax=Pseudolabrys sp. TaxID=1960880 RepID=UPI003D13365E
MAFVAYIVSLVAAFVGVLALYGTLLKPITAKRPPAAQAVAAEKAEPETTSSTRVRPASSQKRQEAAEARKRNEATDARQPYEAAEARERARPDTARGRDEAHEARAQEEADVPPAARVPRTSRHSPVRVEPGEGLRLEPERCWIVTDSTRGFGYYGRCQ